MNLASQHLSTIEAITGPFERIVVEPMTDMNDGARTESRRATKVTGDVDIDAITYLQAKRWQNNVHQPEIDKYIDSLTSQGVRKVAFIHRPDFSEAAGTLANSLSTSFVLLHF